MGLGLREAAPQTITHLTGSPTSMATLDQKLATMVPGVRVRVHPKVGGVNSLSGLIVDGDPGHQGHVVVLLDTPDGPKVLPFYVHELVVAKEPNR